MAQRTIPSGRRPVAQAWSVERAIFVLRCSSAIGALRSQRSSLRSKVSGAATAITTPRIVVSDSR